MASAVATEIPTESTVVLTQEHIDSLAQTYEQSPQPVWVHDLWMRCVYRNRRALEAFSGNTQALVSELVDHAGCVVGRLTIGTENNHKQSGESLINLGHI